MEITIPHRSRTQPIQNRTSEIVKYKLHPALDNLFSKLTASDEIVRIDKLVIDLGTISENELEKVMVERSLKEISDKINRLKISGLTKTVIKPVNGNSAEVNAKFSTTSKSKDKLDQFVYFLQFGHFPWWHKSTDGNGISVTNASKNIFKEVLNVETTLLKTTITPLLEKIQVRKRLIFQFNNSYLYELLKRLNEKLIKDYSFQYKEFILCVRSESLIKNFTDSFYEIAIKYLSLEIELNSADQKIIFVKDILNAGLANQPDIEKEKILIEIFRLAQIKLQKSKHKETLQILVAVIQIATELPQKSILLQEMIQNLPEKNEKIVAKWVEQFLEKTNAGAIEKEEFKKDESIKISQTFNIEKGLEKKAIKEDKTVASFQLQLSDTEGINISNAGLVLIHPFLRYFFDGLNLLDKDLYFKSQSDVFKAIHLLQFIATGQEITTENELPLNKILCGLDITEPVPNSFQLLEEEKEECLNLIKTVLERWDALKTTNPAALKDTFLKREGILKQSGQSWNLIIERNSFDVMLEKLPWSINLIKLPWLSQILYVEW